MESKKKKGFIETESRKVVARNWDSWGLGAGNWESLVKYTFSATR